MESMDIRFSVDATGLKCPKPLTEARKKLLKMEIGEVLEIFVDHDISKKELPQEMIESGDEVLSQEDFPESVMRIVIRKAGDY